MIFEDSISAAGWCRALATGEAFPWSGVELFDKLAIVSLEKVRGGDETRHKYLTHSEWHTDSKFVGLLKVGYQTSILEMHS